MPEIARCAVSDHEMTKLNRHILMSNHRGRRTAIKIEAMGGTSLIQQEQDQHECEESLETQDNNHRRFEKTRIQSQLADSQCEGMMFFNVLTCNRVDNMPF